MTKLLIPALIVVVIVLVLGRLAVRSYAAQASELPQVGQMAPSFTLPNEEGKSVSLESLRGHWVVLYFYPKDMSHGCTIEAHNFERDIAQYRAKNAEIVGVSVDTVGSHKEFCAKDGLNFTLLSDHELKVSRDYGVLGNYMGFKFDKRVTFLINPEGKIVKVWPKVDPSIHSQQILTELDQLGAK